jgi:DNA polymerase IIIc chi subunit
VSDTPRTDAEAFLPHDSKYRVCDVDFVRQLERELNAANERIKQLEQENDALRADLLLWNEKEVKL